jgi:predicted N-acetyltransferase YhbS
MNSGHRPPEPISPDHDMHAFDCGVNELNDWLVRRALASHRDGAARTFVSLLNQRVTGYYALTVASVTHLDAPGNLRRKMPNPVPVALLARLAVDRTVQGKGTGGGLLRDAVQRTLIASENLGIRGMMIHALSPSARAFYEHFGFRRSPTNDMTLMATLQTLKGTFLSEL